LAEAQVDRLQWRWSAAEAAMQKLIRRRPNSAEAHHFHAILFEGLGLWDKSLAEQRRAAQLDPLVPAYRDNVGQALHYLHRDSEALAEFQTVLRLEPNFVLTLGNVCWNYASAGRLREAKRILEKQLIPLYAENPNRIICESIIAYREQDRKTLQAMSQLAERLYARGTLDASWLLFPYAFLGNYDGAMHWLQKSYDDREYGLFYAVDEPGLPPVMKTLPHWHAFMQRPEFRERARARAQIAAELYSG
jgi:tetratricopeptide (TPR) repeat protein